MSSSELDPEMTIIKSKLVVQQTEVTAPKSQLEDELKDLGADLTKVGQTAFKGTLKSLEGFRTFILRGNVIDMAIGIVIGAAFTSVVSAVVGDIITPIIPVPGGSLSGWTWHPWWAGVDAHKQLVVVDFGALVNAIISFLIVAAVLYFFVVLPVNKLTALYHPKEAESKKTKECPHCLQEVHAHATRCPFCTSHLTDALKKPEGAEEEEESGEPVLELPDSLEKLSEKLAEKIVRKATSKLEQASEATETNEGEQAKE
jgi:large conductance mechanosensitive channel